MPETISNPGESVQDPRIDLNTLGNVVAVWRQLNGSPLYDIQASYSTNYGASWSSPTAISDPTESAIRPRVAINDTLAIAVYQQGTDDADGIFSVDSTDFGATWSDQQLLSDTEQYAIIPDISMDYSSNAIVVWSRSDTSNNRIESVYVKALPPAPTISGSTTQETFPLRLDLQNIITCAAIEDPGTFKVYADSSLTTLLQSETATNSTVYFYDHLQKKGISKTYYVTWTNEGGQESEASSVTIER